MVQPSYRANLTCADGNPFFAMVFDSAGEGQGDPVDLRGGARARRRFIGWQTFFDFGEEEVKPNKKIDTKISTPLFDLPLAGIASHDPPQRGLGAAAWSKHARRELRASGESIPRRDPTAPEKLTLTSFRLRFRSRREGRVATLPRCSSSARRRSSST